MKLDKISIDGKKDSIEVLDKIFSAKVNNKLVSSVLYKTNANYKGRHAKTKQQNEVSGPTSKIYAQKGTGGARHASRKAPIFVGGGIAHGPKGELAYKKRKLNKSEKKQSVASLISCRRHLMNLKVYPLEIFSFNILNEVFATSSYISSYEWRTSSSFACASNRDLQNSSKGFLDLRLTAPTACTSILISTTFFATLSEPSKIVKR